MLRISNGSLYLCAAAASGETIDEEFQKYRTQCLNQCAANQDLVFTAPSVDHVDHVDHVLWPAEIYWNTTMHWNTKTYGRATRGAYVPALRLPFADLLI